MMWSRGGALMVDTLGEVPAPTSCRQGRSSFDDCEDKIYIRFSVKWLLHSYSLKNLPLPPYSYGLCRTRE
jgi:hypothetical protein